MKKAILLLSIAFGLVCSINAQDKEEYHTDSRKAIKYFEQALEHMHSYRDDLAVGAAKEATIEDPDFLEAYLLLFDIYKFQKDQVNIEKVSREILRLASDEYYEYYLLTSKLAHHRGAYDLALSDVENYQYYDDFSNKKENIQLVKLNAEFAVEAIKNPVQFEPINVGANVNTQYDDYWPSLTADEEVLVFTINIPRTRDSYVPNGEPTHEDLFVSHKDENGNWTSRKNMGKTLNTPFNEGAQCISSDGRFCIFTACQREDGFGSCDLYISYRRGRNWLTPINLGSKVNTKKWESKPSLSADGKYLYFSRGIQEGNVDYGMDIWCAEMNNGRIVGEAYKLEGGVNSELNEIAPCIHPDGKTLYFSSNGHPGFGSYDIFVSRKQDDKVWGEAINLGYPINTHGSEIGIIVNASGDLAMFASEREGGYGGLDIYEFELYEEARPDVVTYVKGRVYDVETNESLEADCRLYELISGELIAQQKSDADNGKYLVCLPEGHEYAFNVEKQGYLFYSENFSLMELESDADAYIMNIPLQPIKEGQSVVLKNIFFEFDSYELKSSSETELKKLTQFLMSNPHVSIEIGGHTDNVGSAAYDETLSLNRSKSVYEYLIDKGIDKNRLSYNGYGFNEPIADNATDKGRALNRRTEFKIIKIGSGTD
jgi:outer membrane protein OmpA-like peptidoglycan-associated protein